MSLKHATRKRDIPVDVGIYHVLWETEDGHLVTSSAHHNGIDETFVFHADENGDVIYWGEIGYAYPHGQHEDALRNAGYEPQEAVDE